MTHAKVVTVDVFDIDVLNLQQEVLALRNRVERLVALLRLLVVLTRVSGFSLAHARLPDATTKSSLIRAVDRSRSVLPLRTVLRVLRLSSSRYHAWKREGECGLDDMPSWPRSSPQQLTRPEVETIREMVTSDEYRHVPTGTLALLAQRLGKAIELAEEHSKGKAVAAYCELEDGGLEIEVYCLVGNRIMEVEIDGKIGKVSEMEEKRSLPDRMAYGHAHEHAVAARIVEAGCASCIFDMEGVTGCKLAVKIDGKPHLVIGADVDAHKAGLSSSAKKAKVVGKIEGDKFVATSFELQP